MLNQAIVFKAPAPITCLEVLELEVLELKDNEAQNILFSKK